MDAFKIKYASKIAARTSILIPMNKKHPINISTIMSVIPSTAAVKIHAPSGCEIQSLPVLNMRHTQVHCKLFVGKIMGTSGSSSEFSPR